ncbi:MAG: 30S ribosomal protein S21 [Halobacteriovoraceae bacterium]|nr:30S ribosomal protein S21 [Halobacteriovoraceae bacterium]
MAESKKNKENFKISIGDGFPVEKALRKFKRLCDSYGITKTYKARQAYQKPSIKAKEKREAAEKRRRKTNSKNSRYRAKI